ncbi:MAG: DNA replication/repair protein RecF, partial [Eubacteriales bacterium]
KGVNIFYGNNAQGKTNVLEGIYLFAGGKSFRHAKEKDMMRFGSEVSQVSICYVTSERENKMAIRYLKDMKKQLFKNCMRLSRMSEFIGNFKAVLFFPDHLGIVKNDPSVRRSFIDGAISQISPAYLALLMEYNKLLENRNALLKNYDTYGSSFGMTFEIISEKMAVCAAKIASVRSKYLARLSDIVDICLNDMTGSREHVKFEYITNISYYPGDELFDVAENTERYRKVFSERKDKEIQHGVTIGGSHRDDFDIKLNGKSSKLFCSQGQQRSIALAMKLAEGEISREKTGETPVFLFDDVLSELDSERKRYILSKLSDRQVIITSCSESDFDGLTNATLGSQKIYVENGNFYYR